MTTSIVITLLAIVAALQLVCGLKRCAVADELRATRNETASRLRGLDRMQQTTLNLLNAYPEELDEARDAVLKGQKDLLQKLGEDHGDLGDGQTSILRRLEGLAADTELLPHINAVQGAMAERLEPANPGSIYAMSRQLAAQIEEIHTAALPAETGPDRDAHLSKAMEEGVMNLLRYAAGKTSGGVEVGLG